jgi:hypothetical protein
MTEPGYISSTRKMNTFIRDNKVSVLHWAPHHEGMWGSRNIFIRNFNLVHGRRLSSKGNSSRYTMNRRLSGFRILYGRSGKTSNFWPLPKIEKRSLDNPNYKTFRLSEYEWDNESYLIWKRSSLFLDVYAVQIGIYLQTFRQYNQSHLQWSSSSRRIPGIN